MINSAISTTRKERIPQIDYLKCIFILLMIAFHLVYFGDKYPYAKRIVYTFHMPVFLIISGYLVNIHKNVKDFLHIILWMFIPYAIMECGYTVMSAVLPVRDKVDSLSIGVIIKNVFVSPLGPYWYLQTLIICNVTYYFIHKVGSKWSDINRIICLSICLGSLAYWLHIMSLANVVYYIIGVVISMYGIPFLTFFKSSPLSILPFIILCLFPGNLDKFSLSGVIITYLAIGIALSFYKYLTTPPCINKTIQFIGRNTLIILLFSPIFTIVAKVFIPFLAFDHTGICFLVISEIFTVSGSLFVAYLMDKLKISPFFFGKKEALNHI